MIEAILNLFSDFISCNIDLLLSELRRTGDCNDFIEVQFEGLKVRNWLFDPTTCELIVLFENGESWSGNIRKGKDTDPDWIL